MDFFCSFPTPFTFVMVRSKARKIFSTNHIYILANSHVQIQTLCEAPKETMRFVSFNAVHNIFIIIIIFIFIQDTHVTEVFFSGVMYCTENICINLIKFLLINYIYQKSEVSLKVLLSTLPLHLTIPRVELKMSYLPK
jgi:hypothetical protein